MRALTVKGSYRGVSGHDHHVREFVRELCRQGVRVQLLDFADWAPLRLPDKDGWFETLNQPVDSRVMLHFCMPHQVRTASDKLNVNFTMFEASRVPKNWVKENLRHDLVILPTESSKQAWVDSGVPEDHIRLCPLGVNSELFHPDVQPLPLKGETGMELGDYRVRFLNISDVMPRKNLLGLVRTWIRASQPSDDAVLILKWNCGSDKWLKKFLRSIEKMEKKLGKSRRECAPILFLINRHFADADMPKLYAAATHYWSMSRGEGWDLPMMEAAATGLHLIAPHHTAYKAYLDDAIAQFVPVGSSPAKFRWSDGAHKLFKGAEWWDPDETVTADLIYQAIRNGSTEKNLIARDRIATKFTWEKATTRLIEILEEIKSPL